MLFRANLTKQDSLQGTQASPATSTNCPAASRIEYVLLPQRAAECVLLPQGAGSAGLMRPCTQHCFTNSPTNSPSKTNPAEMLQSPMSVAVGIECVLCACALTRLNPNLILASPMSVAGGGSATEEEERKRRAGQKRRFFLQQNGVAT